MIIKIKFGILALTTFLLVLLVDFASDATELPRSAQFRLHTLALAQTSDPPPPAPLILTDEQNQYPLGLHLEILEDPSGELTIDQVSSPEFDSQFIPSQAEVPNYGYTDSAYWVKLQLSSESRATDYWLLEQGFANMHYVDLYTPLPEGEGYSVKQSGVLRPSAARDLLHPRVIFNLDIPPGSQQAYYLRFQNGASMTLPLTLWTQGEFLNQSLVELISRGIFYGILIGLLFYNLFLLISLRDASYLWLVVLLASLFIQQFSYDGYWAIFITPDSNLIKEYIVPWSFVVMIASMLLFSDVFLEIKTRLPGLHWAILVLLAVWGVVFLVVPFTSYHDIAIFGVPWALLSLLVVFIAGVLSGWRGFRPARFFIIAWSGMVVSIFWLLLIRQGLLPSSWFSENLYRLGIVWMVVCWSIALADRINLLKAETERANLALRNSEHRLSQILEGLPIGVVMYGKDRKPNYANRRTVEILSNPSQGIQVDLSAGRTLEKAIEYFSLQMAGSSQTYPIENLPINIALKGEPASADDIEANLGDKRIPLEIWASPVMDNAGNIESAVVAFQDITQRKQAEMALRISETRFRVIAENNFDGIAFMDRDRKVLYASPSYLRLVGKTAEELIGQSGVGLVHPDDRDLTAQKFSEVLQQPNTRIISEYRIPHKDGSWIWVETFGVNMLHDPDVQAVVLNSHDITQRKQAEVELAEYRKHLESLVESRTAELSAANEQLQRHLKWLSAVNFINQLMAQSADFTQIYQQVIEIINNLFATHGSFIVELDAGSNQLKILAHSCQHKYDQDLNGTITTLPEGILSGSSLEGAYPIYLSKDQFHTISGSMGAHLQDTKIQNIALMPLVLREKTYGYLGLEMYEEGMLLTSEAADLLEIFSTDITQIIENQHVYEQSKAMIAVGERNRLARDLHDSVTQVLFSATLLADVLPQIWHRDPELGFQRLEKLRQMMRGALAEMRTLLLELRPTAVIKTPLGDLLAQLTEAVASRTGLPFQLYIEKISPLPEDVQTAFYRIAQEALNNVVKHAQANQVTVSLSAASISAGGAGQEVRLVIQDDGVGFSAMKEDSAHLGIGIMQERAASIHASLSVDSQLGYGTRVTLIWGRETGSET